jgi:hypothetical protein
MLNELGVVLNYVEWNWSRITDSATQPERIRRLVSFPRHPPQVILAKPVDKLYRSCSSLALESFGALFVKLLLFDLRHLTVAGHTISTNAQDC